MNEIKQALEWYKEEAQAAERHALAGNVDALSAIVQTMALDGGKRAAKGLVALERLNNQRLNALDDASRLRFPDTTGQ